MKQILISKSVAYAANYDAKNFAALTDGAIAAFKLSDYSKLTAAPTENFGLVLGRGTTMPAFVIPEVDIKTLTVVKTPYAAGSVFAGSITVPSPTAGKIYTVVVVKKGVGFNERNKFSASVLAKSGDTATTVATAIKNALNATSAESTVLDVTVTNSAGAITVTGNTVGDDYTIMGADEMMGVSVTTTTRGVPAVCDAAYIKKLAQECAENKGFEYLAEDGKDLYPGYPEAVSGTYTLYTLRFAVHRDASKTRDEVVSQIVHIAVPTGGAAISSLDTVFGLAQPSGN